MSITDNYANFTPSAGGGPNIDNVIGATQGVQTAGYNFDLSPAGYIAGNPAVVSGGTPPNEIIGPLNIINQSGGRRKRKIKAKRSRKLKRSNKSRLNSRSKKSRSVKKSKIVRKSLSKRRVSFKKKSKKNRKRKSLK